jgi:hypothetical protein
MAMTKIEHLLFGSAYALFVTSFVSSDAEIRIELARIEDDRADGASKVLARWRNATAPEIWEDTEEPWTFPLDIIGFDCYPADDRWKFTLNCKHIEWSWESAWPNIQLESQLSETEREAGPDSNVRSIFDLGSSGGSNIARNKDAMIGEALESRFKPNRG